MSARHDGGPAFPAPHMSQNNATGETISHVSMSDGVTVRDYFAAAALQGAMSTAQGLCEIPDGERAKVLDSVSGLLYEMADSMLRARGTP